MFRHLHSLLCLCVCVSVCVIGCLFLSCSPSLVFIGFVWVQSVDSAELERLLGLLHALVSRGEFDAAELAQPPKGKDEWKRGGTAKAALNRASVGVNAGVCMLHVRTCGVVAPEDVCW